jgi:hypothetical protein
MRVICVAAAGLNYMKIMPGDGWHEPAGGAGSRPDRQEGTRGDGRTAAQAAGASAVGRSCSQRITASLVAGHNDRDPLRRIFYPLRKEIQVTVKDLICPLLRRTDTTYRLRGRIRCSKVLTSACRKIS